MLLSAVASPVHDFPTAHDVPRPAQPLRPFAVNSENTHSPAATDRVTKSAVGTKRPSENNALQSATVQPTLSTSTSVTADTAAHAAKRAMERVQIAAKSDKITHHADAWGFLNTAIQMRKKLNLPPDKALQRRFAEAAKKLDKAEPTAAGRALLHAKAAERAASSHVKVATYTKNNHLVKSKSLANIADAKAQKVEAGIRADGVFPPWHAAHEKGRRSLAQMHYALAQIRDGEAQAGHRAAASRWASKGQQRIYSATAMDGPAKPRQAAGFSFSQPSSTGQAFSANGWWGKTERPAVPSNRNANGPASLEPGLEHWLGSGAF